MVGIARASLVSDHEHMICRYLALPLNSYAEAILSMDETQ